MLTGRHCPQIMRRALDMGQADGNIRMKPCPGLGKANAAVFTQEQRGTQMRFQSVNRIGNGSLSHQQLTRGPSKAAMAAGRFKHDKAVYGRE